MATMYWRGVINGVWDYDNGGCWSNTSGGASNGLFPDSSTDVVFDSNSGSGNVFLEDNGSGAPRCKSLTVTGTSAVSFKSSSTSTIILNGDAGSNNIALGNAKIEVDNIYFSINTAYTHHLTVGASANIPKAYFTVAAGTLSVDSNVNCVGFGCSGGSLSAVGRVIGCRTLSGNSSYSIDISNSTVTLTGSSEGGPSWNFDGTLIATGSTLIIDTGSFASNGGFSPKSTGGHTYNTLRIKAGSAGYPVICSSLSSVSITTLILDKGAKFRTQGGTFTVGDLQIDEENGLTTEFKAAGTTAWTLSKSSGTVFANRCTISYCTATGGATFYACNSTDGGGNSGWTFNPTARYWVGGNGVWDGSGGRNSLHWAITSGGTAGASAPLATDDVYFNGASGGGTVTFSAAAYAKTLTCTGYAGTFSQGGQNLRVSGNVTLGAGMALQSTGGRLQLMANATVTTNSVTIGSGTSSQYAFDVAGGTATLADALTTAGTINISASCTLNTAGYSVTAYGLALAASSSTLTAGASLITLTGTGDGVTFNNAAGGTITANTATIKFTDATSATKTFAGGGKTYNNLWLSGAGTGAFTISSSNTFNDFKVDTPPHTINFTAGTTQTVTTFTVSGTGVSAKMTLQSTAGGSAWNLSKASGTINCTWLSLQDSHAAGGATFNATSSTNVSGNTGWSITAPSTGGLFGHPIF